MTDDYTERCKSCNRIRDREIFIHGVCQWCAPNPDMELVKRMAETWDKPEYGYSVREYRRAFLCLWNILNPALAPTKR